MKNKLMIIGDVRGRVGSAGVPELNIEDVARGLGFVQIKNHVEYVRWETVNGYLDEFGFSQQAGKDGFIPENIFYKLCFKAKNEIAQKFQDKVTDDILPAIRKHGAYLTSAMTEELLQNPDLIIKLAMTLKSEREDRLKLQEQLDISKSWYSIKRVAALNNTTFKCFDWRKLKQSSFDIGKPPQKIFDSNYGEVNIYHKEAWELSYPYYEL